VSKSNLTSDPPPELKFVKTGKKNLMGSLRDFVNSEELSDVTFVVDGQKFFAHKIILSLLR
jgi:hypothetical protein